MMVTDEMTSAQKFETDGLLFDAFNAQYIIPFFPSPPHICSQMHHQLIPPLLLSFFLILPVSLSVTDERYTNCHRQFECGDIQNVYYPFWGNPSPSYCGLLEFELECIDGFPVMEILSEKFRVLMINHETHYMRIARLDLLNNTCPSLYVNTTISYLFNYAANLGNLTLFYGCSSPTETLASNSFRCRVNDTSTESGYFMVGSIPADENPGKCSGRIHVPILPTATKALMSNSSSLSAVLNDGFEVQWIIDDTACTECLASGGRCGYNTTWVKPICFCPDEPYLMRCPNPAAKSTEGRKMTLSNKIVIAVSVFGACIIVVTTVLIYFLRRKSSWNKSIVFWKKKAKNAQNVEAFLENYESIAPKRYSYPEVKKMTESFKDKLGQGGYGGVYKGKLLDGRLVAVKVLSDSKGDGEEFLNEVVSISRTSHVNIVSLLGFCFEGLKRALIYEFMPNGSLEKFIYDEKPLETNPPLGWKRLYQVAVGIARGLEYLHRGCNTRILHLDIKPQNILLDQDFCPKISDFGLAKLCTRKESAISMMGARGTVGYIAPEVFSRNFGLVSHKSDVYSYGMMVLEMVGRRKNIDSGVDHSSEVYFPHWIYKRLELDEDLRLHWIMTREGEEVARKMIIVGLWCIQTDPSKRPSMSKVLDMLGGSFEALRIPPKPFPSSPLRSPEDASFTSHSSLFLASDDEVLPPQQLQDHALPQCI